VGVCVRRLSAVVVVACSAGKCGLEKLRMVWKNSGRWSSELLTLRSRASCLIFWITIVKLLDVIRDFSDGFESVFGETGMPAPVEVSFSARNPSIIMNPDINQFAVWRELKKHIRFFVLILQDKSQQIGDRTLQRFWECFTFGAHDFCSITSKR
jgi:hypothetical protein